MANFIPDLKLPGEGTLLDYAVKEMLSRGKIDLEYAEPNQKSILFVGKTKVGKTSLIHKFYGTSDPMEPTLMLDYFPSPRNFLTLNKERAQSHIWELGDGTLYEQALIYLNTSPNLTVALCMDLSRPQFLYYTQEEVLNMVLKFIKNRSDFEETHKARVAAMPNDHADLGLLKPFPFPLVIIGCMYDVFYKFEPEKKRIITQFMRYLSHLYGAYLFYWTDRNNEISKQAKEILKHYAYGYDMPMVKKTDYNKAVFVPPYSDSFTEIDSTSSTNEHTLEKYRLLLETHFHQEKLSKLSMENPADDPKYADPVIDLIRKQHLQKEAFLEKWDRKPEEEEKDNFKLINPFADIKPVEFRSSGSDNEED